VPELNEEAHVVVNSRRRGLVASAGVVRGGEADIFAGASFESKEDQGGTEAPES
jgi:hypothetical protein